ncbi:ABC transporter ATP-binding protein [Selenihalanaerobacter shriftii]|uniref:NitT/TauT family transport system ATP-binding protein n=1 Tax=Selenihalanaerobacter shriftii TaxID=142842 RepID=A0A1T4JL25_9FIRM|nr:ABC transporter ATP-binding protein [Selenihalanaerobacter shriftii]SJZ30803.1 NitT/TauT family transport system ATP-binding protein [Selenihalanaerobacter shriftii]
MTQPVTIKNITKEFTDKETEKNILALNNINLEIEKGEFVCIIGASGCGKSTLLNLIAGFLEQTTGHISVGNNIVKEPGPDRGVVFQEYTLFPWLNVIKNVTFGLNELDLTTNEKEVIGKKYLSLVGLEKFAQAYPHELSGGMKQRVAIARVLAMDCEILLMDEPFGALDAQTRQMLQQELLEIWGQEKKTVVFVTHNVDEAVYLADRVVVLSSHPGRIKADIKINLSRPRDRLSNKVAEIKRELLGHLMGDDMGA